MPTRTTVFHQQQPIPQAAPQPGDKYAPNAWLSGGIGDLTDLEVPSGQMCLVRRPGVEGLLREGVLHGLDSLTTLVSEKHLKKGPKGEPAQIDPASLMKDQSALENIMHTVDRVVCHCVVKPEVQMTPNDVTRRQAGVVYADMIDIVDKMHIFNFVVGGTRDLESFRDGLAEVVGGLEGQQGVQQETE